jgi:hypothetical protein
LLTVTRRTPRAGVVGEDRGMHPVGEPVIVVDVVERRPRRSAHGRIGCGLGELVQLADCLRVAGDDLAPRRVRELTLGAVFSTSRSRCFWRVRSSARSTR